jgi:uncharacterized membrane protein
MLCRVWILLRQHADVSVSKVLHSMLARFNCKRGSIVSVVQSFNRAVVQWFNSFALPFCNGSIRCQGAVHWSNI